MNHFRFIIEQALAHITHGKNLKKNIATDDGITAYWGLPRQDVESGMASRIGNWTVKAGLQARTALKQMQAEAKAANGKGLDAIFFHTQITAILCQDWMNRIPSVISLDATPLQYDSLGEFYQHEPGSGPAERVKYAMNRRCYEAAKHIVTWSQWAKDGLIEQYGISADKITVIPPGVNPTEWHRPMALNGHNGNGHSNGASDDQHPTKVLFVGGNLDRKGGNLLLEACRTLRHESYPLELHVVTRDTIAEEPQVFVYNNMQPNSAALKKLYHEADIFCLPTFGDCLPMVLSEAGAAGLPVISTDVAAIPEIVHDGTSGFIVPTGNVDALTSALRRLVVNPDLRKRMGQQAVEQVQERYDAEANARKLLELLKAVVTQ